MTTSAANHGRSGRPWQRLRRQVLARDPHCMIRGPFCTGLSTTVDHIVPLSARPDLAHVLTNLRGACGPCNYRGGALITNSRRGIGGAYPQQQPQRLPCPFHAGCGSVHSQPWAQACTGSAERPCVASCVGTSWCMGEAA